MFLLFRNKNYATISLGERNERTMPLYHRAKEMKPDSHFYASLYIISQYRDENLEEFSHENHAYPCHNT